MRVVSIGSACLRCPAGIFSFVQMWQYGIFCEQVLFCGFFEEILFLEQVENCFFAYFAH